MLKERVIFLLTKILPRHGVTRFAQWFSKIELWPVPQMSIAIWKWLTDADLGDARDAHFRSLHEVLIRRLKKSARPIDPNADIITSPCDAIVGEFGWVESGMALQIKDMPYPVVDLLGAAGEAANFEGGYFVTLRIKSGMYHRFHAPHDLVAEQLRYISGDLWDVRPSSLRRIDRLFCKNERAPMVIRLQQTGLRLVMVPVGSLLAGSIRLPWLDGVHPINKRGSRTMQFEHEFSKGEEMGWFEHGSTIVLFSPPEAVPLATLKTGRVIRMGEPVFQIVELEPI